MVSVTIWARAGFLRTYPVAVSTNLLSPTILPRCRIATPGVGAAAPGATRMEDALLRWLTGVVGYPESAEGDLTSGGSMATLSAVIAAREAGGVKSADIASTVVYLTTHTHHTFRKALHIAGLSDCVIREVPLDAGMRMDCDALRRVVEDDVSKNLRPWLIATSAGTTDAGAVDDFHAIADIAAEFRLWMHVDAAYGGAFALCNEGKERLDGIERSDSLVLDPHKGFFLPCGTGVVLVRDGAKLFDAYHARGTYMQDVAGDTERSPCDYSAELTRPFRALRFWLPFKLHGSAAFAAALEEKLLLASYFYEECGKIADIEMGPAPDLSIVTFRFRPAAMDADTASRALGRGDTSRRARVPDIDDYRRLLYATNGHSDVQYAPRRCRHGAAGHQRVHDKN